MSKSILIGFVYILLSGISGFGSTFSSTSCTIEPNGQPPGITEINPTGCAFYGTNYSVTATAYAFATGGATGSVGANVGVTYNNVPPHGYSPLIAETQAVAQVNAEFTTSGAVRAGTMTLNVFYPEWSSFDDVLPGNASPADSFDAINITQDGVTRVYYCLTLPPGKCDSETIAINLGSAFSIEVGDSIAGGGRDEGYNFNYFYDGMTFTLQDANGSAVTALLVPEPSTGNLVFIAIGCILLGVFGKRRRQQLTKPGSDAKASRTSHLRPGYWTLDCRGAIEYSLSNSHL